MRLQFADKCAKRHFNASVKNLGCVIVRQRTTSVHVPLSLILSPKTIYYLLKLVFLLSVMLLSLSLIPLACNDNERYFYSFWNVL